MPMLEVFACGFVLLPLLAIALTVFAIRHIVRERRRRTSEHSQCLHCGYCLRGLTEQICPECGTPFVNQDE